MIIRDILGKGDCVNTVGLNEKTMSKCIREQEAEDQLRDAMTKRKYVDPFKKVKKLFQTNSWWYCWEGASLLGRTLTDESPECDLIAVST